MRYIEAPEEYRGEETSLFLAGGITGCPDWQKVMVNELADLPLVIFNPRRVNFPVDDPGASRAQIEWEYRYLRKAAAISFWFPKETLCPITLFELGAFSVADKPLFVGAHPEYQRIIDIKEQLRLARPDVLVRERLDDLVNQIIVWSQID